MTKHTYLDYAATGPVRVEFPNTITLPAPTRENMERTAEGYLLCKNVPLARTGLQIYMGYEVPLEPGPDGTVVVERGADEVFRPSTIDSFHGKPFTDDHPERNLGPDNWRQHMVGVVQNPRQGVGDKEHLLLGDILIYDSAVAAAVESGRKRQVSCGYDADYERVEAGRGRQVNILGNHVSLVARGRCGDDCSIMDGAPNMAKRTKTFDKNSFITRLKAAARDNDEGEIDRVLAEIPVDVAGDPEEAEDGDGTDLEDHVRVTLRTEGDANGPSGDGPISSHDEDPMGGMGGGGDLAAVIQQAVEAGIAPLAQQVTALQEQVGGQQQTMDAWAGRVDPTGAEAAQLRARAEVLSPGIKMPVLDAAPGTSSYAKTSIKIMREALRAAAQDAAKSQVVLAITGPRPVFDSMPDAAVEMAFRAAADQLAQANDRRTQMHSVFDGAPATDGKPKRPTTGAELNAIIAANLARQGGQRTH